MKQCYLSRRHLMMKENGPAKGCELRLARIPAAGGGVRLTAEIEKGFDGAPNRSHPRFTLTAADE